MTITIDSIALDFFATVKVADIAGGFEVHEVTTEFIAADKNEEKELVGAGA